MKTLKALMMTASVIAILGVLQMSSLSQSSANDLETGTFEYKEGETTCEGYFARPRGDMTAKTLVKRAGVLVIHDWMGVHDVMRAKCDDLARLGYVAFAADIYGKGVRPASPAEAREQSGKFKDDIKLFRARLLAGLEALKKQPYVDPKRLAAIGYCFGGGGALELARSGAEIGGVVSFHGGLASADPADVKNIKCRVLVLHGADDPAVPAAQVNAFVEEMRATNVDWQLHMYSGAVHSFTNPKAGSDNSKGSAYNERADKRSWMDMRQFFDEFMR